MQKLEISFEVNNDELVGGYFQWAIQMYWILVPAYVFFSSIRLGCFSLWISLLIGCTLALLSIRLSLSNYKYVSMSFLLSQPTYHYN